MIRKLVVVLLTGLVFPALACAELQNVQVGGQITILGEYYRNVETPGSGLRWPASVLLGRPIGTGVGAGNGIVSAFGWDDHGHGLSLVTQWTRLHVNADFTEDVGAFIELDSVDVWGEDFRSDYVTGGDNRANSVDDVEVYQAYIEANEMFGHPLRLRIGRQELRLGSEWLVGANDDGPSPAWGLSFDALRLTYATDLVSVDVWGAKLAERSPAEEDGDVDFYGVYGSYLGLEDITLDAYWLWVRDAGALQDTNLGYLGEWIEDVAGVDDYDTTNLHTVGLRAAGEIGAFDFEAEVAYQFGEASTTGFLFKPLLYGDDDDDFSVWGLNLEAGYTLDVPWEPRVHFGYAFIDGEDDRDITFGQWLGYLFNPFYAPPASVSFNRLFSNWSHSAILDGSEMSNAHIFHLGVEAAPTESIELAVDVGYYLADEVFDRPVLPVLGFWTRENDAELGWEVDANVTYHYSEDFYFCVGWDHLFVGDGLEEGNFCNSYGLDFNGGTNGDDADYFYFETGMSF